MATVEHARRLTLYEGARPVRSRWSATPRVHGIREATGTCRGRESNPQETDLQSVTLAALSPRRSSRIRGNRIEALERRSPSPGDAFRRPCQVRREATPRRTRRFHFLPNRFERCFKTY